MNDIPDKRWWAMCSAGMSEPDTLAKAILEQPFVYDRKFGFFYVPFGKHQFAMSLLLAWHQGLEDGMEAAKSLGLDWPGETADRWLETIPGTAFRSADGRGKVLAGHRTNLSAMEKRILGDIRYLFESD